MNPTKENPKVKEQSFKDGKVQIVEREYTEKVESFEKGQIENYLNEAKGRRDDAQVEVDKWEEMLKLIK